MLADLLELLHTSYDRWTDMSAELVQWKEQDRLRMLADQQSAAFLETVPGQSPPGAPRRDEDSGVAESVLSVTATSQRSVRVETITGEGRQLLVVGPTGGVLSVDDQGVAEVETNPHRAVAWIRLGLVAPMLRPALLAGACRLQVTGGTRVAGRDCLRVSAVVRPETPDVLQADLFGYGVARAWLAVDRATGVLLGIEATDDDGHPVHRLQVRTVEFDSPVDQGLFSVEVPDGTVVAGDDHGPMTWQQAARLAPFTVFAPPTAPGDYPWSVLVTSARRGHPAKLISHQIGIPLRSGQRWTSITQAADPAAMPDATEWTAIRIDGLDAHLWTGANGAHLLAWRDGTGLWIADADSTDAAIRLLASMHPVTPTDTTPG